MRTRIFNKLLELTIWQPFESLKDLQILQTHSFNYFHWSYLCCGSLLIKNLSILLLFFNFYYFRLIYLFFFFVIFNILFFHCHIKCLYMYMDICTCIYVLYLFMIVLIFWFVFIFCFDMNVLTCLVYYCVYALTCL